MSRSKLGFKYQKKRIKRDKKLLPLCPNYKPKEHSDNCEKADFCVNATYSWDNKAMGNCYGGTRSSEIEYRKEQLKIV